MGGWESLLRNAGILTPEGAASVVGLVMFGRRDVTRVPPVHADDSQVLLVIPFAPTG